MAQPPPMSPAARGAFVTCIILPLLAIGVVSMRVVARRIAHEKLMSDDITMIVAMIIAAGICGTFAFALYVGAAMGPPESIRGQSTILTYELDLIIEQLYGIAQALIKISILLFYRRIFFIGRFRFIANGSIALMSVWSLLFLLLFIFPVWPISTTWVPHQKSHQNYDWTKVLLWHAITNIGLDLYVLVLPLPVIRSLHMTMGKKFAVGGIMWLGSFCVVAACIRLSYVVGVQYEDTTTAGTGTDSVSLTALWSVIEPCCSVIAGCLPTLAPVFKKCKAARWTGEKLRSLFSSAGSSQDEPPQVDFVGQSFINSANSSYNRERKGSKASSQHSRGRLHIPWPGKRSRAQSQSQSRSQVSTNSTCTCDRGNSFAHQGGAQPAQWV